MDKEKSITRGNADAWIRITNVTYNKLIKLAEGHMTLNDVIELLLDECNQ
jgi:hypothetical protein